MIEKITHEAVAAKLLADVAVMGLAKNVFDHAPQFTDPGDLANFPYINLASSAATDFSTDSELGMNIVVTVNTWSRYEGLKEVKTLQGLVYTSLNRATLTAAGYCFVGVDFVGSDAFDDSDGKTRHGVQTFRILIEKE